MSTAENPGFRIRVDVTNPGQFFACCGLFELASRRSKTDANATLAHFDSNGTFHLNHVESFKNLIRDVADAKIIAQTPEDRPQTPIWIGAPFNVLLDWWRHESRETGKLKTWAGQMSVHGIALDMRNAMEAACVTSAFDAQGVLESTSGTNDGEPFYFDALRALNANRRDVGFSVDALKKAAIHINTECRPAVEFLCLIGLQRARPRLSVNERGKERAYDYCTWSQPIPIELLPAAVIGHLSTPDPRAYRFTNPSRAKDYRAFMPASPAQTTL
jgi:CRISPR-associated protein Csx14